MKSLILLSFVFLIQCVSSSKYEDLEKKNTELQKKCDETEKKLNEELAACKAKQDEITKQAKASEEKMLAEFKQKEESLTAELKEVKSKYSKAKKERGELKNSLSEMEKAMEELNKRKAETDQRIAEFKNLLAKFRSLIDSGKLKVKIEDGRMVVVLSSDVLFSSGSRELSANGKTAIQEVTAVLAEIPDRKFQVEGHTDSDRYRVYGQTNWELAAFRALNVLHTMVEAGMPKEKISAASFGETRPVIENNSPENKKLNRRIEIVVVPDLSLLPGFEELKKLESE